MHAPLSNVIGALLALAVVAGGCSTTSGPKSLDTATGSVDDTRSQLDRGAEQLDVVMNALRDLGQMTESGDPAPDLRTAYNTYRKELDRLESIAEAVRARRAAMEARVQAHVDKWQMDLQNISSEQARQISEGRREQLVESLQRLARTMDDLSDQYAPLVANLQDIEYIMANDLSAGGLEVTRPMISEAVGQAAEVKAAVAESSAALEAAIAEFRG